MNSGHEIKVGIYGDTYIDGKRLAPHRVCGNQGVVIVEGVSMKIEHWSAVFVPKDVYDDYKRAAKQKQCRKWHRKFKHKQWLKARN